MTLTVDREEVCKQAIKEIGNEAFYIHCDVSKEEDVKKAILGENAIRFLGMED